MADLMANWRRKALVRAIFLIVAAVLMNGCAGGDVTLTETGGQTLSQDVTTEDLLTMAGFKGFGVNDETPNLRALMMNIPAGQLTTYDRGGETYHVYADEGSKTIYIGDDAAYRRYLALGRDRKLCQPVKGSNPEAFWQCMQEYRAGAAGGR